MKKNFLPIAIDIADSKILVVGGGQSALKKIKILQRFDARIDVLAPEFIPEIHRLNVTRIQKTFEKSDLSGYLMLYSCTDNKAFDRQITEYGRESGVLINVHDTPELCQFVSPAIYRDGNISVAVSSNAEDVHEAIRIRNLIQNYLENLKSTSI